MHKSILVAARDIGHVRELLAPFSNTYPGGESVFVISTPFDRIRERALAIAESVETPYSSIYRAWCDRGDYNSVLWAHDSDEVDIHGNHGYYRNPHGKFDQWEIGDPLLWRKSGVRTSAWRKLGIDWIRTRYEQGEIAGQDWDALVDILGESEFARYRESDPDQRSVILGRARESGADIYTVDYLADRPIYGETRDRHVEIANDRGLTDAFVTGNGTWYDRDCPSYDSTFWLFVAIIERKSMIFALDSWSN